MDLIKTKTNRKPAEKEIPLLRADKQLRAEFRFHNFGKQIFAKGGFEQGLIKWIKDKRHKEKYPVDNYAKQDYETMINNHPEFKSYNDSVFEDAWTLYIKKLRKEGARKYIIADLLGTENG